MYRISGRGLRRQPLRHFSGNSDGRRTASVRCSLMLLLGVCIICFLSPRLAAQPFPRHAVTAEYAGILFYGSTSVGYELLVSDRMSFRMSVGSAYATIIIADVEANGATAMVNMMTRGAHKLEAGFGISVIRSNFSSVFSSDRIEFGYHVYPAVSLGYRTLPRRRGFFWRAGVAWMYGYGLPLLLGVGYVF